MTTDMSRCAIAIAALVTVCGTAHSQVAPLNFERTDLAIDSGPLLPEPASAGVVYSETVEVPGSDWVRLWFGETVLPEGAELVVTSAQSGEFHRLNAETLSHWSNSSAYLAGDTAFVDVIMPQADGNGVEARVRITGVDAGLPPIAGRTICGSGDDRVLSNDPRASRLAPQGCTAWLFNNRANSAMTANHCGAAGGDVLWFNVPLRTSGGTAVPPAPEDQYPVDNSSLQTSGGASIGNDWSVFGVFDNSNTGLSPVDAQQDSYHLATQMPPTDGRPITVTGYGTVSFPIPQAWYAVQKTHTGPLWSVDGSTVRYRPDTTGGNSGSAVLDEQDGLSIGIHTNGGCGSSSTSSNSGTSIANGGLRSALMQARGVADGPMPGIIRLLDAAPERVDPEGGTTIGVSLHADFTGPEPEPAVTLHTNDGAGWVATQMNAGFAGDWFATFPASECGADVSYYFSAAGTDGTGFTFPPSGPDAPLSAVSSAPWAELAGENGESDAGWTIENESVFSGGWERGVPAAADRQGGPVTDADGSGACWTTGLSLNVNLNGGPTRLITPVYDIAGQDATVDVSLYMNADGSSDRLVVEASADGGTSWTLLESLASTPGWAPRSYRVSDSMPGATSIAFRFSATDAGVSNTIEAGVDGFLLRATVCGPTMCGPSDIAEPTGVLDLADVQGFIIGFMAEDPITDVAEPMGVWDLADVAAFVAAFLAGCP